MFTHDDYQRMTAIEQAAITRLYDRIDYLNIIPLVRAKRSHTRTCVNRMLAHKLLQLASINNTLGI
jgi:hypothetical protein